MSLLVFAIGLLAMAGCTSIGPRSVVADGFDYTGVLGDSWKQRMLFNLVRVRYGDTPIFLDVASVINQYSLETGVNINGQRARTGYGDTFFGIGGSAVYTDRPTITYIPLSGEKFARSLMKPVPPSALMSMIEAGYPVDLVLRICAESVNGIRNRSGGAFRARPADAKFHPLLERLRRVQNSGAIGLRVQRVKEDETVVMTIRGDVEASVREDALATRQVLGLDPAAEEFRVVYGSIARDNREVAILTRSLLQIIANLAANIEVPAAHVEEQLVNPTAPDMLPDGQPLPPLIRIQNSATPPEHAFVAVPYQDYWFWIDNRDLKSKGLFSFLMFLFSLTETVGKDGAPVVTISAGG
ncbi:MAG: hypothetical protein FIB02_10195 [Desulfuromonas sp.]|nr:hypothetical protein [Desulfuromonas sp.]